MPPKKKSTAPPAKRQKRAVVSDDEDDIQQDDVSQAIVAPPPPIPSEPLGPIAQSYTYASDIPSECSKIDPSNPSIKVPCVLGVDEAGRGPVLGPLVYGIAYCPVSYQDSLKEIGFADSKALTAERRDHLLAALIDDSAHLGWAVRVMSPQDISAGMLRRRPVNLNAQSSQATVGLIAGVLESGVDVTEIYVDTVGDPKSYSRLLSSHFPRHPHIKWTVTSKADAIYPIVGAASIAAKVTRDRCVEGWKYAEQRQQVPSSKAAGDEEVKVLGDATNHTPSHLGSAAETKKRKAEVESVPQSTQNVDTVWSSMGSLGSGYPGDPNTVAYLKRNLDPVFGWPGLVRFSWATAKTMLEEKVKPPSSTAGKVTASAADATPASLGGKRLTRSLSRTSSFNSEVEAPTTSESEPIIASTRPTSIYGTYLPAPSVPGGTAPRGYKVKWIDEPVSISKFFGPTSTKKPATAPTSTASTSVDSTDAFHVSALQATINDWLKREPSSAAKTAAAVPGDIGQIHIAVSKLTKDLSLVSGDATFIL
ncbi:Ribonuclease HII/HIII domain protein [Kalmanozyma brasiliensis GHG001]|uniref:Ribonuclease n=1 Tax=Kalmanozyma brasiliensis (strain GHG001) TaxID=1365824 RepID=V5EQJ7_KALBG|nr:Ribonuclease HII/HIII domain protein [Kalmanozyma brasiliensis GHG001]EST07415.1 Ribonuclease HII/HIII domain protein [Kalmanozyma brasiliensis GHG001]